MIKVQDVVVFNDPGRVWVLALRRPATAGSRAQDTLVVRMTAADGRYELRGEREGFADLVFMHSDGSCVARTPDSKPIYEHTCKICVL